MRSSMALSARSGTAILCASMSVFGKNFACLAVLAVAASACAGRPARPHPPAPPRPLAPEARKQAAQEYYEAVDAYMKEDYPRARELIGSILAADPGNAEALALRRRIQAIEKLSNQK